MLDVNVKRDSDDFDAEALARLIQGTFSAHFPPRIALNKRGGLEVPNKEPDVVVTIGQFKVVVAAEGDGPLPTSSSNVIDPR